MIELESVLKQYFGHDAFRPGQRALVEALIAGRDALGVMPTGAGKSVCYQLPAIALPGVTLVVSPLISLMQDQVAAVREAGLAAVCIHSGMNEDEAREAYRLAASDACKLVYVAPERLSAPTFQRFAAAANVSLVAVDEAHCVSQWGQDFRPSYLEIADFIDALPRRPVVGAFTATATSRVREDIARLLRLNDPVRVTTGFDRPNLYFEVLTPKKKRDALIDLVEGSGDQSGIVYCSTREAVEDVCEALVLRGISATRYHAGLPDEERRHNQADFVYDRARVMVATNAFGMGIDKSNVSFVFHYNMPKDIESYYQEAGRAGRDGSPARCALLYSGGDVATAKFLISQSNENDALSIEEQESLQRKQLVRLNQMTAYCKSSTCLRAQLLRYFGEDAPEHCGHCGNCREAAFIERDITVEAQKILSGVARVERKYRGSFGAGVIAMMLKGSKDQKVVKTGLDRLPTYGALGDAKLEEIRHWISALVDDEYLVAVGDEYPVLRLTPKARGVLFDGERVVIRERPAAEKPARGRKSRPGAPTGGLYEALRALRMALSQQQHIPPYMIFSNTALADMVVVRPHTPAEFLNVSGVGAVKAEKYGAVFLDAIRQWEAENGEAPGDLFNVGDE